MVESVKELRKICYSGPPKKRPLYMEWFTMKLSIYVTKLLLYTPIHADQVTMLMILLAIAGSVLMGFGNLWLMFIGISIIHFTVILDNVNGEIARYYKEGGIIGTFMEQTFHAVSAPLIFFSLGYGVFLKTGFPSAVIFGFLCAIFSSPIILTALNAAIVSKGVESFAKKKPMKQYPLEGDIYVEGGSTKTGRKLYRWYDYIREFWGAPFNIVHIHVLVVLELIYAYYNIIPSHLVLYWYLVIYGTASVIRQFASFIVHYRGKTVYHYYNAIYGKK